MIRLVVKPEGLRGCRCVVAAAVAGRGMPVPGDLCVASIDGLRRFCVMVHELPGTVGNRTCHDAGTFVRIATEDDKKRLATNRALAEKAMECFEDETASVPYDLRALAATFDFRRTSLFILFRSSRRFEPRQAVAALRRRFNAAVEARQAGIREEAAGFGGLGQCGRPVCCAGWLDPANRTSPDIRLAKRLGLNLDPSRLNGYCGRVKCCAMFENNDDADKTPGGNGNARKKAAASANAAKKAPPPATDANAAKKAPPPAGA